MELMPGSIAPPLRRFSSFRHIIRENSVPLVSLKNLKSHPLLAHQKNEHRLNHHRALVNNKSLHCGQSGIAARYLNI
jgi:hypothetical protein